MPSKAELRQKWNNVEKDTVVLHMYSRSKTKPSNSPFILKLETYLRAAGITYVEDFEQPFSAKGKAPWITFNGEDVSDSQFSIDHLVEKLGDDKDLSKDLTEEQKGVERAYRALLEDNQYWVYVAHAFTHGKGKATKAEAPVFPAPAFLQGFIFGQIVKKVSAQAHAQGMGRHSKEEVEKIGTENLRALSALLGDKDYFFGGSNPSLLDVVAFGNLAFVLAGEGADQLFFYKKVEEDFANLKRHFERIKARYWSDWDEKVYVDEKAQKREEEKRKKEEEGERKKKEKEEAEAKKKEEKEAKEKEEKEEKEKKEGEEGKKEESATAAGEKKDEE